MQGIKNSEEDLQNPVSLFYRTCQNFYIELATDIQKRFHFLKDPLFDLIKIVEPAEAQSGNTVTLAKILTRWPMVAKSPKQRQAIDNEPQTGQTTRDSY